MNEVDNTPESEQWDNHVRVVLGDDLLWDELSPAGKHTLGVSPELTVDLRGRQRLARRSYRQDVGR